MSHAEGYILNSGGMMIKFKCLCGKKILSIIFVLFMPLVAYGVPFSSDVIINGSITFDSTNSSVAGTTQSGSISSLVSGASTSSSISGTTLTGTNPLSGALTDLGDGFGSAFYMSGNQNGDAGALYSDYAFNINNNSLTDQYLIRFNIGFSNFVNADGSDAYVDGQLTLMNAMSLSELFFTDLTSDVLFGDKENGTNLASFGASLLDTGNVSLDIVLNPLGNFDLSGLNALEAGVFDSVSRFNGTLSSFISVSSVENLTNTGPPAGVPAPSTLYLMAIGLLGLLIRRKR